MSWSDSLRRCIGRRRFYVRLILLSLVLLLVTSACGLWDGNGSGNGSGNGDEPSPSTGATSDTLTPISVTVTIALETATALPTSPPPTPTSPILPTVTPSTPALPTPFPDETSILSAIQGAGDGEHWATHVLSGSFTAPDASEWLGLVGNIGDEDEIRWVVARAGADGDQLMGVSEWLGAGFDAPPAFYLPPDLLDFDGDEQMEVLHHYFRTYRGLTTRSDTIYRWDGTGLARIWSEPVLLDNKEATAQDVPHPYRQTYQAEWEWLDLNEEDPPEIVIQEQATFYAPEGPSLLGETRGTRVFCWDGVAFRPCRFDGPEGTFAYTVLGDLWLWRDRVARPLGEQNVRAFHWSPDGTRIAWWSRPAPNARPTDILLGIYDLATETRRQFGLTLDEALQEGRLGLHWTPNGQLVYTVPGRPSVLLDPETGLKTALTMAAAGDWSPSPTRSRGAYQRDGSLYVYDLESREEQAVVIASEDAAAPVVLPAPAWSPVGDWIACRLTNGNVSWVGLVAPDPTEPLDSFALLETFDGQEAPNLQFAWSPDGDYLAALARTAGGEQPGPATFYVAPIPERDGQTIGRVAWRAVAEVGAGDLAGEPAWSPDGDRVAVVVGGDVWEVPVEGAPLLRYHVTMPDPKWTTVAWAPDGSGFLVGLESVYDEHLYWFPAGEVDGGNEGENESESDLPLLLLSDSLGAVRWAPSTGARVRSGMVLIEQTGGVPLLHFVSRSGTEVVVTARGAEPGTTFDVGGQRVCYNKFCADREGATSLYASGILAGCRSPLVSPDGAQLAWLCDDGVPEWSDLVNGTAEITFRLVLTDERGRNAQEVWEYIEAGPDYRDFGLVSWREDGEAIYLSRPKYGTAWAYFNYNPGMMVLDLATGQATSIGDLDGIHAGLVSPDGRWLAQSKISEQDGNGPRVSILVRSLTDGTTREVECAEGAMVAGDFSFSPGSPGASGNEWVAWREWATPPGGAIFLIRVLRLPDGEPLTVYGEAETTAPSIGGWIGENELVLVYPRLEDGSGGYSTLVTLPTVGAGEFFSPFSFVGTLD